MSEAAVRKADRVADDLLRQIVSGSLDVGSLLPKEAELASRYEVNRSVVREAIKLLEVHRLVRPVRRRGTEVLDPLASVSPEVLRAMIVPAPGRVDLPLFRDFLEVRAELDIELSVLATRRRTDEDLATLDACVVALQAALSDRARYERESEAFARAMACASQNRVLQMLVWWGQEVSKDLADIFRTVRPANEPHLEGVRFLVRGVRQQDEAAVRTLVEAFHEWATPRLMAAAALSTGQPLSEIMNGI